MNNNVAVTIQEGELKGKRLYDESKFGVDSVFPSEMFFFYQNAVKNNYKIFKFNCGPNHSIIFSKEELNYLNTATKQLIYNEEQKIILESINIEKIKKYQLADLNKLYSLAINNKNIGSIFTLTKNINGVYCFDLILITKSNFNLNDFLKLEFNIFKIISVNELSTMPINFDEIKKLHNYLNLFFKDNFVSYEDNEKPNENLFTTKEYLDYINQINLLKNFSNENKIWFETLTLEKEIELDLIKKKYLNLEKIVMEKKITLLNLNCLKQIEFSCLCNHFIIFDSILLSDEDFFTNFLQVVNGVSVKTNGNNIYLDYDSLTPYSLSQLFECDDYQLFTRFNKVCYWLKR